MTGSGIASELSRARDTLHDDQLFEASEVEVLRIVGGMADEVGGVIFGFKGYRQRIAQILIS